MVVELFSKNVHLMLLFRFIFNLKIHNQITLIKCHLEKNVESTDRCMFPWPNLRNILLSGQCLSVIMAFETLLCFLEGSLEDSVVFNVIVLNWLTEDILESLMSVIIIELSIGEKDESNLSCYEFMNINIEGNLLKIFNVCLILM